MHTEWTCHGMKVNLIRSKSYWKQYFKKGLMQNTNILLADWHVKRSQDSLTNWLVDDSVMNQICFAMCFHSWYWSKAWLLFTYLIYMAASNTGNIIELGLIGDMAQTRSCSNNGEKMDERIMGNWAFLGLNNARFFLLKKSNPKFRSFPGPDISQIKQTRKIENKTKES